MVVMVVVGEGEEDGHRTHASCDRDFGQFRITEATRTYYFLRFPLVRCVDVNSVDPSEREQHDGEAYVYVFNATWLVSREWEAFFTFRAARRSEFNFRLRFGG